MTVRDDLAALLARCTRPVDCHVYEVADEILAAYFLSPKVVPIGSYPVSPDTEFEAYLAGYHHEPGTLYADYLRWRNEGGAR